MAKQNQGVFPPEPRGSVQIETPNGVVRSSRGGVVGGSVDASDRAPEKLPYRDTVTGRYRDRE